MEQRNQDFQERARRQELLDRELFGFRLKLGEDNFTTAGGLLYLVNTMRERILNQLRWQTKSLRIGST
jgi:hypothetical protein